MRFFLEGLDCASCAAKIERRLNKVDGLEEVKVNFGAKSVELPSEKLKEAREVIKKVEPGVKLVPSSNQAMAEREEEGEKRRLLRIALSGGLFFFGFIFDERLRNTTFSWAEYAFFLPSYLLVGWPIIKKAVRKTLQGQLFDENFLMAIATIGAIAIHQFPEAVAVMLFYAVGEYFQHRAVNSSRRYIRSLLAVQPDYANLQSKGEIRRVHPEEVEVGQLIIIKPGEKAPLDGEVMEGSSFVDTSALTGEFVPRRISPGERLLAGMINGEGLLVVKVTKPFAESTTARILELVERAVEKKAPTEQFITSFARYYTPIVVGISVLVAFLPPLFLREAVLSTWVYRALVLLVISCPCALMVSIPLGYFGGIGGASRNGILIKGANSLDALADLRTVVFDKTGTLTKGVFQVAKIVPKNGFDHEDLLTLATGAEYYSNHPIARSLREAYGQEFSGDRIADYQEIPAYGIRAVVDGRRVLVGGDRLLEKEGVDHDDHNLEGTIVYVAVDRCYAGYIEISDQLRTDAKTAIESLRALGVEQLLMLTGDGEGPARKVAEELGLDGYYAQLLPEEKVALIDELEKVSPEKGRWKLAFVGDGMNDAPVIARADIGVAMGGLGSDAAIEAADLVLMEDAPSKLGVAVKIGRRTRRIIRQNISLTLGVKIFFILLGSFGMAGIWEAVFADVGLAILAILNSVRTIRASF